VAARYVDSTLRGPAGRTEVFVMPAKRPLLASLVATLSFAVLVPAAAQEMQLDENQRRAEAIFAELIEQRTSSAHRDITEQAIEKLAARLREAGFPADDVQVVHPPQAPELTGMVARYRGTGARGPLMLMAHVDVVDAEPDAWSFAPFTFAKHDGWYFGRGTTDNKAGVATLMANFIRLRAEGFVPDRDLVMVLTGDEETDQIVIDWLMNDRRDLVDAELALNTDAGGGVIDPNGEPQIFYVQTSEKVYQTFTLSTSNPGGHSSVPRPDNAIYQLAAALTRIGRYHFPIQLNAGTRTYFERSAQFEHGANGDAMRALVAGTEPDLDAAATLAAASPFWNSVMRTTCVATRLQAGHADNALPRTATATVNCRVFPGDSIDDVEAMLRQVIDDGGVTIARVKAAVPSPPSSLDDNGGAELEALVEQIWPGAPVIPQMSTGATDGLYVRNVGIPVLGVSAIFEPPDEFRAHGLDERIGVESFHNAVEFWYRMIRRFSS